MLASFPETRANDVVDFVHSRDTDRGSGAV